MTIIGPIAVAASGDDASEVATVVSITANPLANCDTAGVWNGWRFLGITIPAGSTINSAILTVRMTSGTLDEPDVTIFGLDVATPAAFTTGASNISSRSRTTASVNWSNANAGTVDVNTSDLKTIVQELVDSYEYSSGVMGFVMTTRAGDSARDTSITSFDGSSTVCARLTIDYTAPVAPSGWGSLLSDSRNRLVL
jgi:hypothetical protein